MARVACHVEAASHGEMRRSREEVIFAETVFALSQKLPREAGAWGLQKRD